MNDGIGSPLNIFGILLGVILVAAYLSSDSRSQRRRGKTAG